MGTVLALSGGYLVPPTTVVPFKVGGRDGWHSAAGVQPLCQARPIQPAPMQDGADLDPLTAAPLGGALAPAPEAAVDAYTGDSSSGSGFPLAAIIGAAVGGAVLLLLVLALLYYKCVRRRSPAPAGAISSSAARPAPPPSSSAGASGSAEDPLERFRHFREAQEEELKKVSEVLARWMARHGMEQRRAASARGVVSMCSC